MSLITEHPYTNHEAKISFWAPKHRCQRAIPSCFQYYCYPDHKGTITIVFGLWFFVLATHCCSNQVSIKEPLNHFYFKLP